MKKKIAIIGSGITACASALYLNNKNYKVEIFERKNVIGGILRDIKIGEKTFLSGPQYLEDSDWINTFLKNKIIKKLVKKNSIKFGSFTDLFDKTPILSNNFAHPITTKKYKYLNINLKKNIVSRVNSYQKNISQPLLTWIRNFSSDIEQLHSDCAKAMQIGRVYFKNSDKVVLSEKKKIKFADDLLGLPLKKNYESYFLPKQGYDLFFDEVKKFLTKRGVTFHLNIPIKITNNKSLKFFQNKSEIKADYYVWACNPVPLIKASQNFVLDNPVVKISTFFFEINSKQNTSVDKYFQIFSNKTKINRIYIYKFSDRICVNVESFFEKKPDIPKITKKVKKFLKDFGYSFSKIEFCGLKRDLRHILYTKKDLENFKKFYKDTRFDNVIPGYWEKGGREEKILKLFEEFKKRIN